MIVCLYGARTELNLAPFHIQSKLTQASQSINVVGLKDAHLSHSDVYWFITISIC